ncbi:MAG: hypothetical protein ACYDEG_07915 [bacterium]
MNRIKDKIMLFALNHGNILNLLFIAGFIGLNFLFMKDANATSYGTYGTFNPSTGTASSLNTGAPGILDTAEAWICYRLAPATTGLGLIKGFYDIKMHKPDGAKKAFEAGAAGVAVMLAPTITGAVVNIVQHP